MGPTRIHGLSASSLVGAPTFEEAAPSIWQWLTGRVFVGHNARFDLAFLDAELGRCGLHLPPPPVMCTMRLAGSYLTGLPARTLVACCDAAGVKLDDHQSALADALASAELLSCFRALHNGLPPSWAEERRSASETHWGTVPANVGFCPFSRARQVERRAAQQPPLAELVHRLPHGAWMLPGVDSYLGVLDRVLEDRMVTSDGLSDLLEVAETLGVTQEIAEEAHRQYLSDLAAAAWADGEVTDEERADLLEVAQLLGIATGEALTVLETSRMREGARAPMGQALTSGDRVVFTGEMAHSRAALEASAVKAGLQVTGAVSSKTAVVVMADPHSQSGKAKRARELGIRTVTEQVFLRLVGAA